MKRLRPLLALFALVVALAAAGEARADALDAIGAGVPREIAGLSAGEPDARYGPRSIFDYLDGGGEVYLAYGLVSCLSREYTGKDAHVTLDVFELGSPDDAFGVFAQDPEGQSIDVGQGGLLRSGWLSFYKGAFFVSITSDRMDDAGRAAMVALARAAAGAMGDGAARPELLDALPAEGLLPGSVRLLRSPVLLTPHLDLGSKNPLHLSARSELVLARYERQGRRALVVVARYPDASEARAAERDSRARLARRGGPFRIKVSARTLVAIVADGGNDLVDSLEAEVVARVAPGAVRAKETRR